MALHLEVIVVMFVVVSPGSLFSLDWTYPADWVLCIWDGLQLHLDVEESIILNFVASLLLIFPFCPSKICRIIVASVVIICCAWFLILCRGMLCRVKTYD